MAIENLKKISNFCKWLVPFIAAVFLLFGCGSPTAATETQPGITQESVGPQTETGTPAEDEKQNETVIQELDAAGSYTSKEDVALYIHTYGKLPENFVTKKQAEAAGWVSKEGNLWEVLPGMSIGGDRYGNYEEQLPDKEGRKWKECDIDFDGGYRAARRIIFSNDGLIYYTEDHYKTFEQLY